MWQIINHPPQPFGECTLCKRHSCGEYTDENGLKRQRWVYTPLEMDKGGNLVIGYKCIENMADNLGITKKVIEKVIKEPPTVEEAFSVIGKVIEDAKGTLKESETPKRRKREATT